MENLGGLSPPKPLMSAAYDHPNDLQRLIKIISNGVDRYSVHNFLLTDIRLL